jgi:hypothetical protein
MQGVEDGQSGKQGGGVGQKICTYENAVHICMYRRTCVLASNKYCV